jgi:hypothetical protein
MLYSIVVFGSPHLMLVYVGHKLAVVDMQGRWCISVAPDELGDIAQNLGAGQRVNAIRRLREITHLGLKEAKDIIDTVYPAGGTGGLLKVKGQTSFVMSSFDLSPEPTF